MVWRARRSSDLSCGRRSYILLATRARAHEPAAQSASFGYVPQEATGERFLLLLPHSSHSHPFPGSTRPGRKLTMKLRSRFQAGYLDDPVRKAEKQDLDAAVKEVKKAAAQ